MISVHDKIGNIFHIFHRLWEVDDSHIAEVRKIHGRVAHHDSVKRKVLCSSDKEPCIVHIFLDKGHSCKKACNNPEGKKWRSYLPSIQSHNSFCSDDGKEREEEEKESFCSLGEELEDNS